MVVAQPRFGLRHDGGGIKVDAVNVSKQMVPAMCIDTNISQFFEESLLVPVRHRYDIEFSAKGQFYKCNVDIVSQ